MTAQTITFSLPNAEATHELGVSLGRSLPSPMVILLEGDLGAGKTTLVQGIAAGLGIEDAVVSPTFTILNEYPEGRLPLYHFDLYRLQPSEVSNLYPETYWEGVEFPAGIVAIEWAERLQYLPPSYLQVHLKYGEDGGRQVQFVPVGKIDWVIGNG